MEKELYHGVETEKEKESESIPFTGGFAQLREYME
jgi:hypothetical protein